MFAHPVRHVPMALRFTSHSSLRLGGLLRRHLSSSIRPNPAGAIRILYGSQTGTAQLFASQLAESLEDRGLKNVIVQALDEKPPHEVFSSGDLHLVLASSTGKGEPPDNTRRFYDWIMKDPSAKLDSDVNFAVFGLGNKSAHANNFNAVGKHLDARLSEMGARRVLDIALGDDGGCIEGDFDEWVVDIMSSLAVNEEGDGIESTEVSASLIFPPMEGEKEEPEPQVGNPATEKSSRLTSKKHPSLALDPAQSDVVRHDLFHLSGLNRFYAENTEKLQVIDNHILAPDAGESALHEIRISLKCHKDDTTNKVLSYTTGDHFMVYPRNSDAIVDACLKMLGVDPHAIISENHNESYPYPRGITVAETLSHCVDLGALPSPNFSRMILGREDLDYVNDIANPRRTVIDLCLQSGKQISLEDFLYNATPMKPRYYSIASSSIKCPDQVVLVYRPVRYMTSEGYLREGICTSYMAHKGVAERGPGDAAFLPALVSPNPTFVLPRDTQTPVMFIGGGCGIAPIRAFIEERIALRSMGRDLGPATLFLGFRNPHDYVYKGLVQEALEVGALTESEIVYSSGCNSDGHCQKMLVSDLVRQSGENVWKHIQDGGHVYVCGGARTFGAAIEAAFLDIFQGQSMSFDAANDYLRELADLGQFAEDLAD
jgi:NADPH-ferrihemoprotein reductase